MGRLTTYTTELAAEICDRLAGGESLRAICEADGMPKAETVRRWVLDDVEGFSGPYTRAREIQAETMADDLLDIADNGSNDWMERTNKKGEIEKVLDREHVTRSALRLETRQWLMARILPKKYGVKSEVTLDGGLNLNSIPLEQQRALAAALEAIADGTGEPIDGPAGANRKS